MSLELIREFFGWCLVLNFCVLLLQFGVTLWLRDRSSRFHAALFRIDEEAVRRAYFLYFAAFKIVFLTFTVIPYVALWIMTSQ